MMANQENQDAANAIPEAMVQHENCFGVLPD
jgi:hypothetical protein